MAMDSNQLRSLLGRASDISISAIDPEGLNLSSALHELFHSYLEGAAATPLALKRVALTAFDELAMRKKAHTLMLPVDALCRMLTDFGVIPKKMSRGTASLMAAMSIDASNKKSLTPVVLRYVPQLSLKNYGQDDDSSKVDEEESGGRRWRTQRTHHSEGD